MQFVAKNNEAPANGWELSDGELEDLGKIFNQLDANHNSKLNETECRDMAKFVDAFLFKLGTTWDEVGACKMMGDKELSLKDFKFAVQHVREISGKEQIMSQIGVQRIVAECIPGGCPDYPLMGLQSMTDEDIMHLCRNDIASKLQEALHLYATSQRHCIPANVSDEGGNAKFISAREAVYGEIDEYYEGLEGILGFPNPNLLDAMEREHCDGEDSEEPFCPGNYASAGTTPAQCVLSISCCSIFLFVIFFCFIMVSCMPSWTSVRVRDLCICDRTDTGNGAGL
jgi:hypothetical protein